MIDPGFCAFNLFYSNLFGAKIVLADAAAITLGMPISGIVSAAYNGRGRANLEAWAPVTDVGDWKVSSPRTLPPLAYTDLEEWALSWLPTLGGAPFAETEPNEAPSYCVSQKYFRKRIMVDLNRIVSCRLRPPFGDPFVFLRTRRAAINDADAAGVDPPAGTGARHRGRPVQFFDANYARPRGRSARRNPWKCRMGRIYFSRISSGWGLHRVISIPPQLESVG